jgi:DNA-binding LacI/PurR family transcriptional regulator
MIAVVGFDDIDFAAAPAYQLTTYRQPSDEMVRRLVDMICGRARRKL